MTNNTGIMLRDYQAEICSRVEDALGKERSVMMQMPTGTGKTVVLAELVKRYLNKSLELREKSLEKRELNSKLNSISYPHCQVVIVAHRIELIEQTGEHLERYGIDYGIIAGGRKAKEIKPVMIASIQTLARGRNLDLDVVRKDSSLSAILSPSLVIIDEAHHAVAKTYRMLWEAWPEAKFLGLTATPYRMSGEGFTDLFDMMVMSWDMRRFVAEGWLATFDYYSIRPDSEQQQVIDGMRKRGADGDYQTKEMRDKLDVRPSIERLFETFEKYAFDKKGIIYAIDIAHAEHIAAFYRSQGIEARTISSKTPMDIRKNIIDVFRKSSFPEGNSSGKILENHPPSPSFPLKKGLHRFPQNPLSPQGTGDLKPGRLGLYEQQSSRPQGAACGLPTQQSCDYLIQVLVSVDLFSEGFDCPDVEFIQMARPTLSLAKYLQMVGRGMRLSPSKANCIILDNVGLYRTFGLPTSDRDWEGYFVGDADDLTTIRDESKAIGALRFSTSDIKYDTDEDREVVRIVTHDELAARFVNTVSEGFIRKKKGKTWVCKDTVTGIEFERHPKVIEYRGMEMLTTDYETYYPRIRSQWIDVSHGINVKALETQAGDGLSWKMLYVSLSSPDKVYRLQEVLHNDMRVYKDETGTTYFQQDLDHTPVSEKEAGGRHAFMDYCDRQKAAWLAAVEQVKHRFLDESFSTDEWQREHNAMVEEDGELCHVIYEEHGERREVWADRKTGFYCLHKPVARRRGFVELLYDGDMVFVRNIYHERYIPYRNWEIKADGRLCTIGNRLYMREKPDVEGYRILRRSGDFVMFVVQGNNPKIYDQTYTIINKMGREVEIKE